MLLVAHRTPATPAGCDRLAAAGARVFEVDVQLDDAERVLVSHYLPLGPVLQRDNWRLRPRARAVRDPLLAEVLARVPDGCEVLLDLKERSAARADRLVAALTAALGGQSGFIACGGQAGDLDRLRAAGFRTWRTIGDAATLRAVLAGAALPDEAVSVRQSLLSREVVAVLHERVPAVVAWTVNQPRRAAALRRFGVDGVTTDRLAVLQSLAADTH